MKTIITLFITMMLTGCFPYDPWMQPKNRQILSQPQQVIQPVQAVQAPIQVIKPKSEYRGGVIEFKFRVIVDQTGKVIGKKVE